MITTKADELVRSLIEAGIFLTDFTILATKVTRIQRDFKMGHEDRRQRDRLRQQEKLKEQTLFEQQLRDEEERRQKGLAKLRELGYVTNDETYPMPSQTGTSKPLHPIADPSLNFYSKEINEMKQKQRDCCLTFNIDYDLRLNQQNLERACRSAKRNIYQLRAERFNRPDHRSILSVETITLHNKLKEAIRELNKVFLESKSAEEQRVFQELISYINQYEGDIDLLMCQMQYEPKVKETILFAPVTTDILDRMNLILHIVRSLAKKISTGDLNTDENELLNSKDSDPSNLPTKATYVIKVKTNDHAGSALSEDAKVSAKLYGTNSKSADVRLIQSINPTKWQAGQIDLFNIELNYLGEIYAMEIWHDSEYSSWKVDWVDIIDDGANVYHFPIDRLLDKHAEEKTTRFMLQRDVGPVRRLPTKPTKQSKPYKQIGFSTYKVQVKTGKQPNKATDSSIFLQLKGENGTFADNLCSANSAFKGSVFEPDQLDTFYLVWPDLGKIDSLHLSIQSEGANPPWFCEYITVEDSQRGESYKFVLNQLFDGSSADDRHAKKSLTAYPEKSKEENAKKGAAEKNKPSYLLKIKTGEKGLSDTANPPAINLVLQGEKNKSNPYTLPTADKKRPPFRENQTDEFVIPSEYHVGPIKSLKLTADNATEPWFIENLIVRDIQNGQDYIFPLYQWLNEPSGKNTITAQPINERKPEYTVYTRTIASELNGPDRSIKLNVQGKKGTEEMRLDQPVSMFNSFQPGRKDEYHIDRVKSLGELQSIEVDVTHPNIKKLGLDYIEIKDRSTNESYRFNINRMLDAKNPKMIAKAEKILRSNPSLTKTAGGTKPTQLLSANTTTGTSNKKSFEQMTTSVPQGAKRPTTKQELDNQFKVPMKPADSNLQTQSDDGNEEKDSVNIPSIGNLKSATLSFDENLSKQSSTPTLEITDEKLKKTSKASTDNEPRRPQANQQTSSVKDTDTKGNVSSAGTKPKSKLPDTNVYQIKLKTLKREFLDKETKLQVELIDDQGESERKILDPTAALDKGKIETFSIETAKKFDRVKDIRLALIGSKSKKQDVYQAEFIEIIDPKTKKMHRVDYAKDDVLNLDKNRLEIVKSLRSNSDLNVREKTHPQGSSPPPNTSKSPMLPASDRNLLQHDSEDLSSLQQTISTSTFDNMSDRVPSTSSRQIRPGDRVKSGSNRQLFRDEAKSPMYEANWYRRSIEAARDHQEQAKQRQLVSSQRLSQTKFDKQTANSTKFKTEGTKRDNLINRQGSKDSKINAVLPKKSSSKSLKQQATSQVSPNLQKHWNELQAEMIEDRNKMSSKQLKLPKDNTSLFHEEKVSSVPSQVVQKPMQKYVDKPANYTGVTNDRGTEQRSVSNVGSSNTRPYSSRSVSEDQTSVTTSKAMSTGGSHHDPAVIIDSPAGSNIVEMSSTSQTRSFAKSSATTTTTQTKSSSQASKTPGTSTSSATSTLTRNVPSDIRPTSDQNVGRSAGVSSATTTTTSTSRSNPSGQFPNEKNRSSMSQFSKTTGADQPSRSKVPASPYVIDSTVDERQTYPNTQGISSVSIHTIATKSDSDSHMSRKSTGSHDSEYSLRNDSLLSPESAKKLRRKRRQEQRSKTLEDLRTEQTVPAQTSKSSSNPSISNSPTASNQKYLNKETSDIQYASRPSPLANDKSRQISQESQMEKPSDQSIDTRSKQTTSQSASTSATLSSAQTSNTSHPSASTSAGQSSQSFSNTTATTTQSDSSTSKSTITNKTNPYSSSKLNQVEQMSTVFEESEPSTGSTHTPVANVARGRVETNSGSSSRTASPAAHQPFRSPSKFDNFVPPHVDTKVKHPTTKTPPPSSHHMKTINAKSVTRNNTIDYEFRVQTGNGSRLDGTNEPVIVELTDEQGHVTQIPLHHSVNNSKPFQKGQLDIFHLTLPENFQAIKKLNLSLPKSHRDSLHIRYCELQDRETMNTLYFPIETWLGEKNTFDIDMFINKSQIVER